MSVFERWCPEWLGFGLQFLKILHYLLNLGVDFFSLCVCLVACVVVLVVNVVVLGDARGCHACFLVFVYSWRLGVIVLLVNAWALAKEELICLGFQVEQEFF